MLSFQSPGANRLQLVKFMSEKPNEVEGEYKVADMGLVEKGKESIYVAARKMPVTCNILRERFAEEKPLQGIKIAGCLHVTKETANLAITLTEAGAEVLLCGSNPLSTQDDVSCSAGRHGHQGLCLAREHVRRVLLVHPRVPETQPEHPDR